MPASPSTPRLYRIVFVFWESSAFERYSLWNYWVCWDSFRFGILSDRTPLFYIRDSLLFARNHWKPSVKPIISTRCCLPFHRNHICWYVLMYENAGTGYHPVTQFWWKLLVLFFSFSGVGRASESASPPGHPLSRLALPDSLGRQQEAQPTATKSVKPKNRKPNKNQHMDRNWEAVSYPFW